MSFDTDTGNMEKIISGRQFDCERALYNLKNSTVENCIFAGPADGESVLKEARDIKVKDSSFSLRYPMWHVNSFTLENSKMDELCRAALWYCRDGFVWGCDLGGIKAVRECENISVKKSRINSCEFGWKSHGISVEDSEISSEYLFLDSKNVRLDRVKMDGKYSFQYMENLEITDSNLDTKDAFWHSKNVTVRNCEVKGEYPGWFSDGLTLIDCKISGTQPFCYCKNLTLINCTMDSCDLSFEYSEVNADIRGHIDSVKNPKSGKITADSIGQVIWEDAVTECKCRVSIRSN